MGRTDGEDKRSRVARGALVVLGFGAVILVAWMVTLYEKPEPVSCVGRHGTGIDCGWPAGWPDG